MQYIYGTEVNDNFMLYGKKFGVMPVSVSDLDLHWTRFRLAPGSESSFKVLIRASKIKKN
jgi:hypothetical protein